MEIQTSGKSQALTDEKLVKVLLVEDDVIDRKLVERTLAKSLKPVEFTLEFAESLSVAIEQLSNNKRYDIILLDLMLSDSQGVETVQRIHEINPQIPIVVLTGLDDEQAGLSAIENGATDYLIKGQGLSNILVRAILYALARKKETEEWWKTFDIITDWVFVQDKDFTITKANKAFAEAIKSKPEDVVGKKCYEVTHNRNSPWPDCPFKETKRDKKSHTCEVNDPNIGIPLLISISPTFDNKGEVIGSVHIAKDITERKKLEKQLQINKASFYNIVEKSTDGVVVV